MVAAVGIAAILVGGCATQEARAIEVLLEPTASPGLFPWTKSVVVAEAPTSVPITPQPASVSTVDSGQIMLTALQGDRVGIYGGSLDLDVCDKEKLISFLEQNPSQARAWIGVLGVSDLRAYMTGLTPVILGADTRVTNHGFEDGKATAHQSVLQAGTAVLIDDHGVPRVRCQCGNPLLAPVLDNSAADYTGAEWSGFSPGQLIVVRPSVNPMTQITVVDVKTGKLIVVPIGGRRPPPPPPPPPTELGAAAPPQPQEPPPPPPQQQPADQAPPPAPQPQAPPPAPQPQAPPPAPQPQAPPPAPQPQAPPPAPPPDWDPPPASNPPPVPPPDLELPPLEWPTLPLPGCGIACF